LVAGSSQGDQAADSSVATPEWAVHCPRASRRCGN
jgi:hypothetical protein